MTDPLAQTLTLIRGDDIDIPLTATQPDGTTPLDLTGVSLVSTVSFQGAGGRPGAVVMSPAITVVSATAGTLVLGITAAMWALYSGTGRLAWDLQATASGKVTTLAKGTIVVVQDVTL